MSNNRNTVFEWFLKGLKPTELQFKNLWGWIWFKDEKIPATSIEGLQDLFLEKADDQKLTNHINDASQHLTPELIAKIEGVREVLISDNLTGTSTNVALSENQGRVLKGFIDQINTLLNSDDTTLNEFQELVNFIKQNKSELSTLSIPNIAGLEDELASKLAINVTGAADKVYNVKGEEVTMTKILPGENVSITEVRPNEFEVSASASATGDFSEKEDDLGFPSMDGQVLASQEDGTRYWVTATADLSLYIYEVIGLIVVGRGNQELRIIGEGFTDTTEFEIIGQHATIVGKQLISPKEAVVTINPISVGTVQLIAKNGNQTSWNIPKNVDIITLTTLVPGDDVPWTNIVGTIDETGVGTLASAKTNNSWDSQAQFGFVPAARYCELKFTYQGRQDTSINGTPNGMFGLSRGLSNRATYGDVRYAIFIQNGADLVIYESGGAFGRKGSVTIGDVFSIKRIDGKISYYHNDVKVYESTKARDDNELYFDCCLFRNIRIDNITLSYE